MISRHVHHREVESVIRLYDLITGRIYYKVLYYVNRSVQWRCPSALASSGTEKEPYETFSPFGNLKACFHCTHLSKKFKIFTTVHD